MKEYPTKRTFRNYIYFWIGLIFSLLGSSVVSFSIPVWITMVYKSEILTSFAFFVTFIPPIIIAPIAGVYADKLNRKWMIFFADTMQALITLTLIIFFAFNLTNYWLIITINFLRSTFQSINFPPLNAIIPTMVPKEHLSRMNGLNYLFTSFVNVVGPVVGGIALSLFPIQTVLWIDIITYLIAIVPLLLVSIPDIRDRPSESEVNISFWNDFKKGFKVLKLIPGLLTLLLLATLANFFENPLSSLLSNFILIDNNGTTLIYAIVNGSLSLGVFIGAIIATAKKNWKNKIRIIVWGIIIGNLGYLLIAISPYQFFIMMIIGGIFYGFFLPIVNTMFLTIIQSKVPAKNQGRVMSLAITISSGITPISIILAGPLTTIFGIANIWFTYATVEIIVCIIIWFLTSLKNLDKIEKENIKSKIRKDISLNKSES